MIIAVYIRGSYYCLASSFKYHISLRVQYLRMQERYEEPDYEGEYKKPSLLPSSTNTGTAFVEDSMYSNESLFRSQEDSDIYKPLSSRAYDSSRIRRPLTPLENDRMMNDMMYDNLFMKRGDVSASRIRSDYNRASPMPHDGPIFLDKFSPLPSEMGEFPQSRRHSPMYPDREFSYHNSQRDIDRLSPIKPDSYNHRSNPNMSSYFHSPIPRDPNYLSPPPYDYAYDFYPPPPGIRRRSPVPPYDIPYYRTPPPPTLHEESESLFRPLSSTNMADDFSEEYYHPSYRAKSVECPNEDDMVNTESSLGTHCVSISEDESPREATLLEGQRQRTPMVPLDEEERIAGMDERLQENNPKDDMNAIFASCEKSKKGDSRELVKKAGKQAGKQIRKQAKKQPKASKPAEQDADTKKSPCRDFENGVCSRGNNCKYYHDPSKAVYSPDKIPICKDFMNGDCKRERCRFRHPGTRIDNVLMGIEQPFSKAELKSILKKFSPTLTPLK